MSNNLSEEAQQVINVARDLKLVTESNLHTLQTLFAHRVNSDLIKTLIMGKEANIVDMLFSIMKGSSGPSTLGYTLRFTADLAQLCPSVAAQFASRAATGTNTDPCVFFADLIDTYRDDFGIFNPAIFLLGCTLAQEGSPEKRPQLVSKFLAVCQTTFSGAEISLARLDFCICACAAFLRLKENRFSFAKNSLIPHIPRILTGLLTSDSPAVVQPIYELLLCARLLSFEFETLGELQKCRMIPVCHRALQRSTKEKCTRMAVYVLKNFGNAELQYRDAQSGNVGVGGHNIMILTRLGRGAGPQFLAEMVGVAIPKTAIQLHKKKYGDTDINLELENLLKMMDHIQEGSTSWSEYRGELDSGVLDWSPCHTNVKFWKENVKNIDGNNFDVVKKVGDLILQSTNEITLAVACHDLGEIIRIHPNGHLIMKLPQVTGVKERVMALMSHDNHEVSKNALACVKKMLVLRWEH